jgi:hypothetical protein
MGTAFTTVDGVMRLWFCSVEGARELRSGIYKEPDNTGKITRRIKTYE